MGNVPRTSSSLHAKLGAELPRFALLMLAAFGAVQASSLADEPLKLALVSASGTASITVTTNARSSVKVVSAGTNAISLSAKPSETNTNSPANTGWHRAEDSEPTIPVALVITKKPEPGLFSGPSSAGSFGLAGFEAGYGQAYDSDSIVLRGRNGTVWEETRYVFFKKVVKF